MNERTANMKNPFSQQGILTRLPLSLLRQAAIAMIVFSLMLLVCVTVPVLGQENDPLPMELGEIISAKQDELKQFAALRKTGPPEKALASLGKIVALHRQALKVAVATTESDEGIDDKLVEKLRTMFLNDSEFYSNQLLLNNRFKEAGIVRRELEKSYGEAFGKDDTRSINFGWDAVVAEKLAIAPKEAQAAYMRTLETLPQANQSRNDGKFDVAAVLYEQVLDATVTVLGESHPKVALVANARGIVAYNVKKYDDAERFYKQAIRVREACGELGLPYATTQNNLGMVYSETKKYAEAEKQYLSAAAIEKRELGESNPSYIRTLQQLAVLYRNSNEPKKLALINQKIAAADPLAVVLRHLPKEAFVAAATSPSKLPGMAGFQLFPFEVLKTVGLEEFGVDPMDVESVVAFATLPVDKPPLKFGCLFKLKNGNSSKLPWLSDMKPAKTADGKTYYSDSNGGAQPMCFFEFDDGVLFYGCKSALEQATSSDGISKLTAVLRQDKNRGHLIAAMDVELVTPALKKVISEEGTPPLPPQLTSLLTIPADTQTIRFWLNLSEGFVVSLMLDSTDQVKATRNAAAVSKALEFALPFFKEGIKSEILGDEPMQVALRAYADRVTDIYYKKIQPRVVEDSVLVQFDVLENQMGAVAFAFLLPAVEAARDAAQNTTGLNKLKQIGLAMHNYHDTHKKFPARANYDKDGKPLLSWRVHLLPFLEQDQLYSQFKLDEPWDSPTNIKLAAKMPDCYRNLNIKDPTKTMIMTLDGEGTFMEGKTGLTFASFVDGTSNTIMLVEANPEKACVWTQPVDLPFDPDQPGDGVGSIRPEGFHAALVDGSVRLVPATISEETLRRLMIRNDGKIVDLDW